MIQYYLEKNGETIGPFRADQLIENGMTPDSMVWNSSTENWCPATYYPEVLQQLKMCPAYAEQQFSEDQSDVSLATTGQRPMMGFWEAVKECWNYKFDFSSRSRRSEFWWFQLALFIGLVIVRIIFIGIAYLLVSLALSNNGINLQGVFLTAKILDLTFWGILIVFGITNIAVTMRRLHDTNRSGWWYGSVLLYPLILLILFLIDHKILYENETLITVGGIFVCILCITVLVFCCLDSDKGENKYGPSPKYQ